MVEQSEYLTVRPLGLNDMGIFRVNCIIQSTAAPGKAVTIKQLVVDTGSEFTWIARNELARIGVTVRKKDVPFVMANGVTITPRCWLCDREG
jgi:hypothetical protein